MIGSEWIVKEEKGKQTVIVTNSDRSGIQLTLNKSRGTISLFGWYDSFVGIEGGEIALSDLEELMETRKKK